MTTEKSQLKNTSTTINQNKPRKKLSPKEYAEMCMSNLYAELKRSHKTLDVSEDDVWNCMENKGWSVPPVFSCFKEMMAEMYKRYGYTERKDGADGEVHYFLRLRKTLQIPEAVKQKLYTIFAYELVGRENIDNAEMGILFRQYGIDYKKYNYPDLTAFLREFEELFSVKVEVIGTTYKISHEINQAKIEHLLESEGKKYEDEYKKELNTYIKNGYYTMVVSENRCRQMMKRKDQQLWEFLIKAISAMEEEENGIEKKEELTDWEKSILTYDSDINEKVNNLSYMQEQGFAQKDIFYIKKNLEKYPEERLLFSALGQRVQKLCGKHNVLEYYCYRLGLIDGVKNDKIQCLRFLILYCADFHKDLVVKFWEKYSRLYVTQDSMEKLLSNLYESKQYEELLYLAGTFPAEVKNRNGILLYEKYTNIILKKESARNVCAPEGLIDAEKEKIINGLLEELLVQNRIEEVCFVICTIRKNYSQYITKEVLDNCIVKQKKQIIDKWSVLLACEEKGIEDAWRVLNYLTGKYYFNSYKKEWKQYKEKRKAEMILKVSELETGEEKSNYSLKFTRYFPDDDRLENENYEYIKQKLLKETTKKRIDIFKDLIVTNNTRLLKLIYKKNEIEIPKEIEIWESLCNCYEEEENYQEAITARYRQLEIVQNEQEKVEIQEKLLSIIKESCTTVYELKEEIAENILFNLSEMSVREDMIDVYSCAIMALTLHAKNPLLAALIYSLANCQKMYSNFVRIVEKQIEEYWGKKNQQMCLGNLFRTCENIFINADLDEIMLYFKVASKILKYDDSIHNFNYKDLKERNIRSDETEKEFMKSCILRYEEVDSWRNLAHHMRQRNIPKANCTVNLMLMYYFNDESHSLTYVIQSMHGNYLFAMPKKFLENNLLMLKKDKANEMYWTEFATHIYRKGYFKEAALNLINDYYEALFLKEKISDAEAKVIISILEQTRTYKEFFEILFIQKEEANDNRKKFERVLQHNVILALKFLLLVRCDISYEMPKEWEEEILCIQKEVEIADLNSRDKIVLDWIHQVYEKQKGGMEPVFAQKTRKILIDYPKEPVESVVKETLLVEKEGDVPNYILIRLWLEVYKNDKKNGTRKNLSLAYKYMANHIHEKESIEEATELLYWITNQYFSTWNNVESKDKALYLANGKKYLALKYLTDREQGYDEIQVKIEENIKRNEDDSKYEEYKEALKVFWESKIPEEEKREILYCGVTQRWWDFLSKLLLKTKREIYIEPLTEYIKTIDFRLFHRELLKMYLYAYIADYRIKGKSVNHIINGDRTEIKQLQEKMETDEILFAKYIFAVREMTEQLCPLLAGVMEAIDFASKDSEELEKYLQVLVVARRKENDWKIMAGNIKDEIILKENPELYSKIVIPCLLTLQYPKYMASILEEWAYTSNPLFETFISDEKVKTVLGNFLVFFYEAVYWVEKGAFQQAQESYNKIQIPPINMKLAMAELSTAIDEQRKMKERYSIFGGVEKSIKDIKLSFMHAVDPEGVSFEQLRLEMQTNDKENALQMCKCAQKIYYYLQKDYIWGEEKDHASFIFQWGFYSMESACEPSQKLHILRELIGNIEYLQNPNVISDKVIKQFITILNEYEFLPFIRDIKEIENCCKNISTKFQNENSKWQVENILLQELFELEKELKTNSNTEKIKKKLEDAKTKIQSISFKNQGNYFARRSKDFIDMFGKWRQAKGLFEVSILNVGRVLNESIFYQIENVGIEPVSDIRLIMYIKGYDETLYEERIYESLRPNQIYASEYIPKNIDLSEGSEVECVLELRYEKDGEELTLSKEEKLVIQKYKQQFPQFENIGYMEESADKEHFVIREKEINDIRRAVNNNNNIVIYGTNGTGKTSILNYIEGEAIPKWCQEKNQEPIIIRMVPNKDSTVNQLVEENLLKALCEENGSFSEKIRNLKSGQENLLNSITRANELKGTSILNKEGNVNTTRIITIFEKISQELVKSNVRLFLMWDNFEHVISSKYITADMFEFIKSIAERESARKNISFIFSGSNYLLEVMEDVDANEVWKSILFRSATKVKIGNMRKDDFVKYMEHEKAIGEVKYSKEALDYLWKYTNGHAFYSCLVGNSTLKSLSERQVKRIDIYPSDIMHTLSAMSTDTSSKAADVRTQIFQDISDNTAVKLVGKTLADYVLRDLDNKIEKHKLWNLLQNNQFSVDKDEFETALKILCARDFIKKELLLGNEKTSESSKRYGYSFNSELYLEYFKDVEIKEEKRKQENKKSVLQYIEDLSIEEIEKFKMFVGTTNYNSEIKAEKLEQHNTFGENSKQEININVNTITQNFVTILSGQSAEDLLKAYGNLPKIQDYQKQCLSDENYSRMLELDMKLPTIQNADEKAALEEELMVLNAPAQKKMEEDYTGAIFQMRDELVEGMEEKKLRKLLSVTSQEIINIKNMPMQFHMQFHFATMLHNIFEQFPKDNEGEIDYCPVTLMYCKLIESMLKKLHTDIYIKRLTDDKVFKKLVQKEVTEEGKRDLTIGSYTYPIVEMNYQDVQSSEVKRNIIEQLANSEDEEIVSEWEQHAKALAQILVCRNKSAHKDVRISKEELKQLIGVMFKNGGLLRIVALAEEWS